MLAVGIILIVFAALALTAALVGGSNDAAVFDLGLFQIETNTLGVFLLGAATVLIFVMGLELLRSGVRRGNRRRKEHKELNRLSAKLGERERNKDTDHESNSDEPTKPQ